jgi:hypothetical protein
MRIARDSCENAPEELMLRAYVDKLKSEGAALKLFLKTAVYHFLKR